MQLAKDSRLVHCPHFENGVAKIQSAQENTLNAAEKAAVEIFKIDADDISEVSERRESTVDDIVAQTLAETQGQVAKRMRASKYCSTAHVSPTSCICEQSNSHPVLGILPLAALPPFVILLFGGFLANIVIVKRLVYLIITSYPFLSQLQDE